MAYQVQPEAKALPKQVKMEIEDKYHLEKFKARASDGHHRDISFQAHMSTFVRLFELVRAPLFNCLNS